MKHKYSKNLFSKDYILKNYNNDSKRIVEISYYQLKALIDNKESFNLFIGGVWCRNCRAIFPTLISYLEDNNKSIYMLDPRNGYKKKKITDFRKCLTSRDEEKLVYLTKNISIDKQKRVNETYKIKIPFITRFNEGMASKYFEEEYLESDITSEVEESIKNKLNQIL